MRQRSMQEGRQAAVRLGIDGPAGYPDPGRWMRWCLPAVTGVSMGVGPYRLRAFPWLSPGQRGLRTSDELEGLGLALLVGHFGGYGGGRAGELCRGCAMAKCRDGVR